VLPSGNPSYSPTMPSATPSIAVSNSPSRSPLPPPSTLVDRPQRKRGKLPKETTDFLKAWLHRHSDHPYPSEEEKKQLCHATGLSMSQVSNWMINVRPTSPCKLITLIFALGSASHPRSRSSRGFRPDDDSAFPSVWAYFLVVRIVGPRRTTLVDANRRQSTALPPHDLAIHA
jgi:hypothetical protein